MGAGCCDNKAFGEPCADCAFDEGAGAAASASESHQSCGSGCGESEEWEPGERAALAYGILTARSDPGLSDFWAAMSAGHMLTASSDGGAASAAFMREQLQNAVTSGSLLGSRFSVAQDEFAAETGDGGTGGSNRGGLVGGRRRGLVIPTGVCCVEDFEYPSRWDTYEDCGDRGCKIGFYFEGQAKYKNALFCACECCEFRQYVQFEHTLRALGDTADYTVTSAGDEHHEDCVFKNGMNVRSSVPQRITPVNREAFDHIAEADEDTEVFCYGRSAEVLGDPDDPDVLPTVCHYKMWDRTEEWSDGVYDLSYSFIGRIHDVCRFDMVVAEREFTLERSGTVVPGSPAEAHEDFPGGSGPGGRQRDLGFPH